ncbi:MAG: enolase C-terminal domain-like protein [Vicinamibacterales bacterium]
MRAVRVDRLSAEAFRLPTDQQESDGTLAWDATTVVVVHASGGGATGLGYTYSALETARLITSMLADVVTGADVMHVEACYQGMRRQTRNVGSAGIASAAISAVDVALWDLKARVLDLPLVSLLGASRESVPAYGSGGFTSYSVERLQEQLAQWAAEGFHAVKMKVGRHPEDDAGRVAAARAAIGGGTALFVDANGAYDRAQAAACARDFAAYGVSWFEEPVTSDDREGLRLVRDRAPAGMEIAAGEYGYHPWYFRRLAEAGAVDIMQADATRCGGVTGFMRAAAICDAWCLPLSAHTAPQLHTHLCGAAARARNLEYFHDHVRIEQLLFEGAVRPSAGRMAPDLSRPGLGIELRRREAARFAV